MPIRGAGGCGCFPSDTPVDTPHGRQAIATLKVGDPVLAEDPATGKVEAEPVQGVIVRRVTPLLAVDLSDGSSIRVTDNHRFWVDGGPGLGGPGWVLSGLLKPGDRLRTADGKDVTVLRVRWNQGEAVVYTLTVARDHTFFVGSARVLVHNANGGIPDGCPIVDQKTWGKVVRSIQKAVGNARNGRLEIPSGSHANTRHAFPSDEANRIVASADKTVYISEGGDNNLLFYLDQKLVVVKSYNSGAGSVISAYGDAGDLGTSGARAYNRRVRDLNPGNGPPYLPGDRLPNGQVLHGRSDVDAANEAARAARPGGPPPYIASDPGLPVTPNMITSSSPLERIPSADGALAKGWEMPADIWRALTPQ